MKTLGKFFLIILLAAAFTYSLKALGYIHVCEDSTHKACDGVCTCDGMNCP